MASHALLLGVSRFGDARLQTLNAPANDVQALAAVLRDPERGGFDRVTVSTDQDYLGMRDRLFALFRDRHPDDLLLVYYSGHGVLERGNALWLASPETDLDDPGARSIAAADIRDRMDRTRAERQVLILDCCHSGAFAAGAKGAGAAAVTEHTFGAEAAGRYVLTASDAQQFAWDGDRLASGDAGARRLSHFTGYLIDGAGRGQAAPDEPDITMDALFRYIDRRARADGSPATPQRFVNRASGDFVIARNPAAAATVSVQTLAAGFAGSDWQARLATAETLSALARKPRTRAAAREALADQLVPERDFKVRSALMRGLEMPPEPADAPTPTPTEPRPGMARQQDASAVAQSVHRRSVEKAAVRNGSILFCCCCLLPLYDLGITANGLEQRNVRLAAALLLIQVLAGAASLRWNLFIKTIPPPPGTAALVTVLRSGWVNYERRWLRRSLWLVTGSGVLFLLAAASGPG